MSPGQVTVRPYDAGDHATVLHLWQQGFAELGPHQWRMITASPWAFLFFAVPGAVAAYASRPLLGAGLVAFGSLLYTPAGLWVTQRLMWRAILGESRKTMAPSHLAEEWATPGRSAFWTALDEGGRIVGCVGIKACHTLHKERAGGVKAVPGEASIWRLSVTPEARRLGVGRALMDCAETWAAANGARNVTLVCGTPPSQAFYRRLGYDAEEEARAREVVFGPSGSGTGIVGLAKLWTLRARLTKTIFRKELSYTAYSSF
jgi:GNAT superfamily N-acetyltransferase